MRATILLLILSGCAAEAVEGHTLAVCEAAAAVSADCGEAVDAAFWDRCFADPAMADEVASLGCEAGKSDLWGKPEWEGCWWSWQCSGDLRCRPTDRFKTETYRCQPPGVQESVVTTFRGEMACGGLCDGDGDCASGYVCKGSRDVFGSDRGERAGMCVEPPTTQAALTACGH